MPRQHERITFLTEISLECSSGYREARISDLSLGGCYIDSIATVKPGEEVAFKLERSGEETIEFRGRVAYVLDGIGFGVNFIDLSDDASRFIAATVGKSGE